LFIFPTRFGWQFLVGLLVLLLVAINYQNNLVYGLTFWLAMVGNMVVLHTSNNMLGLSLQSMGAEPVYAGDCAHFTVRISSARQREHRAIWVTQADTVQKLDVASNRSTTLVLEQQTTQRGEQRLGRLTLASYFPLGWLRCWSPVSLDATVLVYPKPLEPPDHGLAQAAGMERAQRLEQSDDVLGFRAYRPGDRLRDVQWRLVARQQPLVTKEYATGRTDTDRLSWYDYPNTPTELRLSYLCFRVRANVDRCVPFELELPEQTIRVSAAASPDNALRALALFSPGRPCDE
jgi:uncharacterized protein (DUF58 family)